MRDAGGIAVAREDPRKADVAALVAELDAYMRALYPPQSNHLLDIDTLAQPEVTFLVARRNCAALGCAALRRHGPDYGEVKRVYVLPAARGQKLGRLLLERLEDEARLMHLPLMRLETGIHQPQALGLFTAVGFARCRPFGDDPVDDPNSVFMEKPVG